MPDSGSAGFGGITAAFGITASAPASTKSPSRSPAKDHNVGSQGRARGDRLLENFDLAASRRFPLAAQQGDARQDRRVIEGADLERNSRETSASPS